jgi:ppGpp synthetase/RelA/SpoT-type nucleotidyltranferase
MSKYSSLWEYVQRNGSKSFKLTFDEIKDIAGIPIDHSFLNYKKELMEYGYQVGKISLKEQTVVFNKIDES